jgi:hypothetical protein
MDDTEYAEKYDVPYPDNHWEKWQRMGKQMVDARFIEEEFGGYISAGGGAEGDDKAFLASLGLLVFPTYWSEARIGLGVGGASSLESGFSGLEAGVRVQTPTRLAPFVGCGGYAGGNGFSLGGDSVWDDDDESIGVIYPELGVHLWINGSTRASLSAAHWFTTVPGDHDLWVFSLSLAGI